jgi:hypothetical protein
MMSERERERERGWASPALTTGPNPGQTLVKPRSNPGQTTQKTGDERTSAAVGVGLSRMDADDVGGVGDEVSRTHTHVLKVTPRSCPEAAQKLP